MSRYGDLTERPRDHNYPSLNHEDDEDDEDTSAGFSTFADFNNKRRYSDNRLSSYNGDNGNHATSSMLLNETVLPPSLSTDWEAGETSKRNDAKAVRRRTLIVEKRRSCRNTLIGGNRWKVLVFVVFAFLIALGLTLYFVIPRIPAFTFLSNDPLSSSDNNATVTTIPAAFSFLANVSLAIDARASYIPVTFRQLSIELTEVTTNVLVATGQLDSGFSVPGQSVTPIIIPVTFSGTYKDSAVPIYGIMRSACTHIFAGQTRPTLSLILSVDMQISGIIGSSRTSAQLADLVCPVQFSATAS